MDGKIGANEIGSFLIEYLTNLHKSIWNFSFFSDSCSDQNCKQFITEILLSRAYLPVEGTTELNEDVIALADVEQREALRMVASQTTIDLIKKAAEKVDQY